jgi:hypothetical protein
MRSFSKNKRVVSESGAGEQGAEDQEHEVQEMRVGKRGGKGKTVLPLVSLPSI